MNTTALPYWMEVVRAIGPTLGSLLIFATAATAAIVAYKTYRQRKEADDLAYRQRKEADERAEWWRRTQWAVDYASDIRPEKVAIGISALDLMIPSPLAHDEDRRMLVSLFEKIVVAQESPSYNGSTAPDAQTARSRRRFPWSRGGE
jgi:hypothetical protein